MLTRRRNNLHNIFLRLLCLSRFFPLVSRLMVLSLCCMSFSRSCSQQILLHKKCRSLAPVFARKYDYHIQYSVTHNTHDTLTPTHSKYTYDIQYMHSYDGSKSVFVLQLGRRHIFDSGEFRDRWEVCSHAQNTRKIYYT